MKLLCSDTSSASSSFSTDNSRNFRMPLITKLKKVPLPPLRIWSQIVDASSVTRAYLDVKIVSNLFWNKLDSKAYCVIGKKGYFVVYTKDLAKKTGYAFDLTSAKKISVVKKSKDGGKTSTQKATIKWSFGKLIVRFEEETDFAGSCKPLDALLNAVKTPLATSNICEDYCAYEGRCPRGHDARIASRRDEDQLMRLCDICPNATFRDDSSAGTEYVFPSDNWPVTTKREEDDEIYEYAGSPTLPQHTGSAATSRVDLGSAFLLGNDAVDALRAFLLRANSPATPAAQMPLMVSMHLSINGAAKDSKAGTM